MTGFGEGEARSEAGRCTVQIQSVNGRYAKLNISLPREIASLEAKARDSVRRRLGRGQVSVYVCFIPSGGFMERVVVDRGACRELVAQLNKVRHWLAIEGALDLRTLVNTGAVVKRELVGVKKRPVWALLRKAIEAACVELLGSQEREGRIICQDLTKRWRKVDSLAGKIEELRPRAVRRYEERLKTKVRTILDGADYDESRLLAEVGIYADKADISEELLRFGSHLAHFRRVLSSRGEVGKKLDFTVQEILREVNTLSNKANDERISRLAIDVKAELEKVREQLQNIQ